MVINMSAPNQILLVGFLAILATVWVTYKECQKEAVKPQRVFHTESMAEMAKGVTYHW